MKLILLDRNVISTIRQKLNNQKISPYRIRVLRKLNRSDNFISPILSIREGQSGIRENAEKTKTTITNEANLIARFFTKAKTDSEFLINEQNDLSNVFGNNIELSWDSYELFLIEMNDILFQPISKQKQQKYENIIFEKALHYNIDKGHPVVICCLSTLYGCNNSRGILKFKPMLDEKDKRKNIFNALNDLMVLSRLSMIKAANTNANKKYKIKFITFDNKLCEFLKSIKTNYEQIIEYSTEINVTYSKKLFPDLNEDEFTQFIERLKYE